jgi:hypothetical protein
MRQSEIERRGVYLPATIDIWAYATKLFEVQDYSEAVKPVWEKYAERVGQERIDRVVELQAACEQS